MLLYFYSRTSSYILIVLTHVQGILSITYALGILTYRLCLRSSY